MSIYPFIKPLAGENISFSSRSGKPGPDRSLPMVLKIFLNVSGEMGFKGK